MRRGAFVGSAAVAEVVPGTMGDEVTYLIVGGGLQAGLLALSILHHQKRATVTLVERDAHVGGNHTWCFHSGDMPSHAAHLAEPLTQYSWPSYRVRFPDLERSVPLQYRCFDSAHLAATLTARAEQTERLRIRCNCAALSVHPTHVTVQGGGRIDGDVVLDARGPDSAGGPQTGYQKFVGLDVELAAPVTLGEPILMDATVTQRDGFRFFYVLPFSPTRLLIEDTYFSNSPALDVAAVEEEIHRYAAAAGWDIASVNRREQGVLPMPWVAPFSEPNELPVQTGYRGGWFHPATGYSVPVAARLAEYVGLHPGPLAGPAWDAFRNNHRRQFAYGCLLNRFLFTAFAPSDRWHVFSRFYRLPLAPIERFYALRMTAGDRVRMLAGRPPRGFSIRRALTKGTTT